MVRRAASAPRIAVLIDVEVDPACEATYLFAPAAAVPQLEGVFVRTTSPEPPGTALRLRVPCADGTTLELEGEVAWCNPAGLGCIDPGMGVRLVDCDRHDRQRLVQLIGRIAYLDPLG